MIVASPWKKALKVMALAGVDMSPATHCKPIAGDKSCDGHGLLFYPLMP